MSSEFNVEQILPFIGPSAFEVILDQLVAILLLEEPNLRTQATENGKAQGTLTLPVQPSDGDTMTVDTKVYLFQATLTNVDGNIQIGVDLATTQANIVAAFSLSGVAGTDYADDMTAHPSVDIAAFSDDKAVLTAQASGAAGDLIATTQTFIDDANFFDDTTLGATRPGVDINEDDFGFKTVKQIANPFQAGNFDIPIVNVLFKKGDLKTRSKVDVQNKAIYTFEVYAKKPSTETVEGMTESSLTVNRVMGQIFRIFQSPKYINLRLAYKETDGNLVKFIEKLSVTTLESVFPKDPFPVENVTAGLVTFNVDMIENLADLDGAELEIINTLLLEPGA